MRQRLLARAFGGWAHQVRNVQRKARAQVQALQRIALERGSMACTEDVYAR